MSDKQRIMELFKDLIQEKQSSSQYLQQMLVLQTEFEQFKAECACRNQRSNSQQTIKFQKSRSNSYDEQQTQQQFMEKDQSQISYIEQLKMEVLKLESILFVHMSKQQLNTIKKECFYDQQRKTFNCPLYELEGNDSVQFTQNTRISKEKIQNHRIIVNSPRSTQKMEASFHRTKTENDFKIKRNTNFNHVDRIDDIDSISRAQTPLHEFRQSKYQGMFSNNNKNLLFPVLPQNTQSQRKLIQNKSKK